MFSKGIKIGEGEKYDLTRVSSDGVTKEEATKNNAKLIDIFNSLDVNKDGKLSQEELAQAMDGFMKGDTSGNNKLSKKELNKLAEELNKNSGSSEIKGSDVMTFIKNIISATQNDTKENVQAVLQRQQEAIAQQEQREKLDNVAKKLGYEPTNHDEVYYNKDKNDYIKYDKESNTFKPAKYDNSSSSYEFKTAEDIKAEESSA